MSEFVESFPFTFCSIGAHAGSYAGKGAADCQADGMWGRTPDVQPRGLRQAGHRQNGRGELRRSLMRDLHSLDTERVMAGMVGLLALCEHMSEKPERLRPAFPKMGRTGQGGQSGQRPRDVLHAFGGRPLNCVEAPGLYAILADISRRAGLAHTPELFLLPCEGMNAYALGDPEDACISVTRELLRRLSREEIAGILAHEVAHILHRDSGAMRWAFAIQREIADLVRRGIGDLMTRCQDFVRIGFQALLLAAAPVMAELLIAALSRVRELAADARAMDLIDHPKALVAALCKLEYFHTGLMPSHAHLGQNAHALHSHPGTWERISFLA